MLLPEEAQGQQYPVIVLSEGGGSSLARDLAILGVVGLGAYIVLKYLGFDLSSLFQKYVVERYSPPSVEEFEIVDFRIPSPEDVTINKHEAWGVDVIDSVTIEMATLKVDVEGVERSQKVGINVEFGIYDGKFWPKWYSGWWKPFGGGISVGSDPLWFEGAGRVLISLSRGDEGELMFYVKKLDIPFVYQGEKINAISAHLAFKVYADGLEDYPLVVKTGYFVDTRD